MTTQLSKREEEMGALKAKMDVNLQNVREELVLKKEENEQLQMRLQNEMAEKSARANEVRIRFILLRRLFYFNFFLRLVS